MMRRKIELLAPVGGKMQLRAAVQNGADAVYLGGPLFNARINADNFTKEDMIWAVNYAHERDVRVYVTMNTLIFDSEMQEALEYAAFLYEIGVDALIVQDFGLINELKKQLPDFPLHLSTQASIFSKRGVEAARNLGFERVVLARELSLTEIEDCCKLGTEIEVFVHGALCFCYSGQCQLSRVRGGRSGNRGLCAQPCRLKYEYNGKKDSYALSPKDICTIDYMGELIAAGVTSFKIEGRMKSPEYVACVVGIYRKYIDEYLKNGFYTVSDSDRLKLEQIFNRGGFTSGYLKGNPDSKLMCKDLPKHRGIYIGSVHSLGSRSLVKIKLENGANLSLGDGIEIHSPGLPGNVVTYIKEENGLAVAGDIKMPIGMRGELKDLIKPGDKVFKISDKAMLNDLRKSFEPAGDGSEVCLKMSPVSAFFSAHVGEKAKLVLSARNNFATNNKQEETISATSYSEVPCEEAIKRALTEEVCYEQLSKMGKLPFELKDCKFDLDSDVSMPLSAINAMRRAASEELILKKHETNSGRGKEGRNGNLNESNNEKLGLKYSYDGYEVKSYLGEDEKLIPCPIDKYLSLDNEERGKRIPYILNISKGSIDKYIEENFSYIVEMLKKDGKGIGIGNLSWINAFVKAGVKVYGDFGLNVINSAAKEFVEGLGVAVPMSSLELMDPSEVDFPLMICEHMFSGSLKDRDGRTYPLIKAAEDKTLILSGNKLRREY